VSTKVKLFWSICVVGIILDQLTKYWVYTSLAYNRDEITIIPGFLSIVHAQNPGAAMGLLRDYEHRHYLFLVFTLIATGVVLDLFRRLPREDWFMSTTLGLILSGAIGNAIDRIHKGTVTDFIRVYTEEPSLKNWLIQNFGTNEWPSFNVADSALVVGVLLFMVHHIFLEEEDVDLAEEVQTLAKVEKTEADTDEAEAEPAEPAEKATDSEAAPRVDLPPST
jgi:signal peptidase II